jgi:hypothetical protein
MRRESPTMLPKTGSQPRSAKTALYLDQKVAPAAAPAGGRRSVLLSASRLKELGLTGGHLRSLIAAGCLEEGAVPQAENRSNGRSTGRTDPVIGLVLSDLGRALLRCYANGETAGLDDGAWVAQCALALRHMAERPIWNRREGELWWKGTLVKRFGHMAEDQWHVLEGFQAHGWQTNSPNPLPGRSGCNRKQQLRSTIQDLNRGQHPLRIRFRGDGRGGVWWEANRC